MQEFEACHASRFGQREQRARDHCRRVQDDVRMRIVEIKDVRADPVDERGVQHVEPLRVADDGALRRSREFGHRCERVVHGVVVTAAERSTDPVNDGALGRVEDARRQVGGGRSGD